MINTYIDDSINEAKLSMTSAKNIYDKMIVGSVERPNHYYKIAMDDFFLKYKNELKKIITPYVIADELLYKPKTVSYQLYNTTELWMSLLRINGMRNISEFNQSMINIYDPGILGEYMKIFFQRENKTM